MINHNAKNNVAVLGIDLAKQSFQLHGVDSNGATVPKKKFGFTPLTLLFV
jgi:transposase